MMFNVYCFFVVFSGEVGVIEGMFGTTGKFRVTFRGKFSTSTVMQCARSIFITATK